MTIGLFMVFFKSEFDIFYGSLLWPSQFLLRDRRGGHRGAMASGREPVHGLVGEDDEARSG